MGHINDLNSQLIAMYRCIKSNSQDLCNRLIDIQNHYNKLRTLEERSELYYSIRDVYNQFIADDAYIDDIQQISRFMFLVKHSFGNLYRVNNSGYFNVSFRKLYRTLNFDCDNIFILSKLLKHTIISCGDFMDCCIDCKSNDFVFFDPPYYNTFDKYQDSGFLESDHYRLFTLFETLTDKGVKCMISNSNSDFIKDLYHKYNMSVFNINNSFNHTKNKTAILQNLIITNY